MMLMGRGTASGFSGVLACARSADRHCCWSWQHGLRSDHRHDHQRLRVRYGRRWFVGESAPSVVSAAIAVSAGQYVPVATPAVAGAIGYKIYVGTGAAAPATSAASTPVALQPTPPLLQGALPTTTTTVATLATNQGAGSSLSAYATGYDGILPTVLGSSSGYINKINAAFSTANPGSEFQTVFGHLGVSFDPATGFIDFPGGAKKFTIRYDAQTDLYWSIVTPVIERHQKNGKPGGIRNTLALVNSRDLRHWKIRCILLYHPDRHKHGFQYVDWQLKVDAPRATASRSTGPTTTSTARSIAKSTNDSSTPCWKRRATRRTYRMTCRTSRRVCRWKNWRAGAAIRCASGR